MSRFRLCQVFGCQILTALSLLLGLALNTIPTFADEIVTGKVEQMLAEDSSGNTVFDQFFIRVSEDRRIPVDFSPADRIIAESQLRNLPTNFSLSDARTNDPSEIRTASILQNENVRQALPIVTGAKSVAFVIFSMSGGTNSVTAADITRSMNTGWFGTGSPTVQSIFANNSFGSISSSVYNTFGPIALSHSLPSSCDTPFYNSIGTAILNAISAASVDLSPYSYVVYVLPQQVGDRCGWLGTTWSANRVAVANEVNPVLVTHELGHLIGMGHSAFDSNNDGIIRGADGDMEYGDPSCIMGGVGRYYNLAHLQKQEWWLAAGGNMGTFAAATTSATYSLQPFAPSPSAVSSQMQAVQVDLGFGEKYFLTFAKNVAPFDASFDLSNTNNNRIFVTRTYPLDTKTYLVAKLTVGQSFEDLGNSVTVEFQSQSGTTANLRASRGALDSDGDGIPNAIDTDDDADGFLDGQDCAPLASDRWQNFGFVDSDLDGFGESAAAVELPVCFGVTPPAGYVLSSSSTDNCPSISNPTQANQDGDNLGDACDTVIIPGTFPTISISGSTTQRTRKSSHSLTGTATGGISTRLVRVSLKAPGSRAFSAAKTAKKLSTFGSSIAWSYTLTIKKKGTYQVKFTGCNGSICSTSSKIVKVIRQ